MSRRSEVTGGVAHTGRRGQGFLGEPRFDVVALNVALERLAR